MFKKDPEKKWYFRCNVFSIFRVCTVENSAKNWNNNFIPHKKDERINIFAKPYRISISTVQKSYCSVPFMISIVDLAKSTCADGSAHGNFGISACKSLEISIIISRPLIWNSDLYARPRIFRRGAFFCCACEDNVTRM